MGEVILTMKGIDKSFPGVHALDHVDLEVRKGEVLALMGENGAGKSTLMKVLTGIYKKDSGTITYEGKEVEFANTREAQDNGNCYRTPGAEYARSPDSSTEHLYRKRIQKRNSYR